MYLVADEGTASFQLGALVAGDDVKAETEVQSQQDPRHRVLLSS